MNFGHIQTTTVINIHNLWRFYTKEFSSPQTLDTSKSLSDLWCLKFVSLLTQRQLISIMMKINKLSIRNHSRFVQQRPRLYSDTLICFPGTAMLHGHWQDHFALADLAHEPHFTSQGGQMCVCSNDGGSSTELSFVCKRGFHWMPHYL